MNAYGRFREVRFPGEGGLCASIVSESYGYHIDIPLQRSSGRGGIGNIRQMPTTMEDAATTEWNPYYALQSQPPPPNTQPRVCSALSFPAYVNVSIYLGILYRQRWRRQYA
jgi:hypothetical protein